MLQKNYLKKVTNTALQIEAYYVCCFFLSPVTGDVEHRVGYFEDGVEAEKFSKSLDALYGDKWKVPYCISSNVSYIGLKDHDLFGGGCNDN